MMPNTCSLPTQMRPQLNRSQDGIQDVMLMMQKLQSLQYACIISTITWPAILSDHNPTASLILIPSWDRHGYGKISPPISHAGKSGIGLLQQLLHAPLVIRPGMGCSCYAGCIHLCL